MRFTLGSTTMRTTAAAAVYTRRRNVQDPGPVVIRFAFYSIFQTDFYLSLSGDTTYGPCPRDRSYVDRLSDDDRPLLPLLRTIRCGTYSFCASLPPLFFRASLPQGRHPHRGVLSSDYDPSFFPFFFFLFLYFLLYMCSLQRERETDNKHVVSFPQSVTYSTDRNEIQSTCGSIKRWDRDHIAASV